MKIMNFLAAFCRCVLLVGRCQSSSAPMFFPHCLRQLLACLPCFCTRGRAPDGPKTMLAACFPTKTERQSCIHYPRPGNECMNEHLYMEHITFHTEQCTVIAPGAQRCCRRPEKKSQTIQLTETLPGKPKTKTYAEQWKDGLKKKSHAILHF